jgi:hypothetical protein
MFYYFYYFIQDTTSGAINEDIKLTVKLSSSGAAVKWLRNGTLVEESAKYSIQVDGETHTLIIKASTVEDVGEYTCVAENVRSQTELEVKGEEENIELEDSQKEQVGVKGQDVTFTVQFKRTYGSKPEVKWSFNGKEITTTERVSYLVSNAASKQYKCFLKFFIFT